jgi:hypothetical protein
VKGPDGKDPHATTDDEEGDKRDSSEEDEGEVGPNFVSTYLTCTRAEIPRCSIVQEGDSRSKRRSVSAPTPDRNRKRARGDAHAGDAAFSEVDINLHLCRKDGSRMFNLREVDSIERKMYRRSEEEDKTFTFGMTLTSNIRAVVSLHYFPKLLCKATRPLDKYEKKLPGEGPVLSIYWQGRWIPYSMVRQLPKALIGQKQLLEFKDRLRGTIWFPRKMLPSNNKLHLNKSPNEPLLDSAVLLHDLKSNEPRDIKIEWDEDKSRNVQSKFKSWITKCHEAYDREITFTEMLPDQQKDAKETLFRAFIYGNATYKVGDTVKLRKGNHFYRITEIFRKESPKHAEDNKSYPEGQFRAQRLPLTAFGCDAWFEPIKIEELSDEPVSEEDLKSYKDKIDEIEAGLPEKLIVANKSKQSRGQVRLNDVKELDPFTLTAGERLPELAVYVQSRGGKAVEKTIDNRPGRSQSRKLEVTCKITLTATYLEKDKGELKALDYPKDCTPWDGTWKCPEPDKGAFVFDALRTADGGESENFHYQAVAPPSPEKLPETRQYTDSFPPLVPADSACGVGRRLGRTPSPSLSRPFSSLSTQRESPWATRSPRPSPSTLSPLPSLPAVAPTPHPTAPVREATPRGRMEGVFECNET